MPVHRVANESGWSCFEYSISQLWFCVEYLLGGETSCHPVHGVLDLDLAVLTWLFSYRNSSFSAVCKI